MTSSIPRTRFMDLNLQPLTFALGSYAGEMLGWGFFAPAWWRNYLHVHSFFEICFAFQGAGVFRMRGVDHPVVAGNLFVAKPGEPHEIISSTDDPLGIYFWSYTLVPQSNRSPNSAGIDTLLDAFVVSGRCVNNRTPSMPYTLELLTEEIVQRQHGYIQALEGLVDKMLIDTARSVVELPSTLALSSPIARTGLTMTVQQMLRYLRDNYQRPIVVRDVAAQIHLSERHTSRLFQQALGVSIMEYVTNLRIAAASQLLLNRRLSISDVATASGYPDLQHFTTLFKRHTGMPPGAFRRDGGTQFLNEQLHD